MYTNKKVTLACIILCCTTLSLVFAQTQKNIIQKPRSYLLKNATEKDDTCGFTYNNATHTVEPYNGYSNTAPDADTFTVMSWSFRNEYGYENFDCFAYDKNGVYYQNHLPENTISLTSGADGKTYKQISGTYYKDKSNVYFTYKKISGTNLKKWKIIDNNYSKDDKSVFYQDKKIPLADPKTFKLYKGEDMLYGYDKNHVYFENILLTGESPKGAKVLYFVNAIGREFSEFHTYFKTTNSIFIGAQKLSGFDAKTFEILAIEPLGTIYRSDNIIAADTQNGLFAEQFVTGLSSIDFTVIKNTDEQIYMKSNGNIFCNDQLLGKGSVQELTILEDGYAYIQSGKKYMIFYNCNKLSPEISTIKPVLIEKYTDNVRKDTFLKIDKGFFSNDKFLSTIK